MINRRILREKAIQGVFAYAQQRAAAIQRLEVLSKSPEISSTSAHAEALYDLRTVFASESPIQEASDLPLIPPEKPPAYRFFYEKLLHAHQQLLKRSAKSATQLFEEEIHQLVQDEYLLTSLYLALYDLSRSQSGRLSQSPLLAALDQAHPSKSALKTDLPPPEVVSACYEILRDSEQVARSQPSQEEDLQYLLSITRGKWLKVKACHSWMSEEDRCWSVHKSLVLSELIQNFKKSQTECLSLDKKYTNLDSKLSFGRSLCERSISSYVHWSTALAKSSLHWELKRINLIDRVICIVALSEIYHMPEIPLRVSMNEYIEISKTYGGPKSPIFVNGLLDGVVQSLQKDGQLALK